MNNEIAAQLGFIAHTAETARAEELQDAITRYCAQCIAVGTDGVFEQIAGCTIQSCPLYQHRLTHSATRPLTQGR
jgi:hypothetical protein